MHLRVKKLCIVYHTSLINGNKFAYIIIIRGLTSIPFTFCTVMRKNMKLLKEGLWISFKDVMQHPRWVGILKFSSGRDVPLEISKWTNTYANFPRKSDSFINQSAQF